MRGVFLLLLVALAVSVSLSASSFTCSTEAVNSNSTTIVIHLCSLPSTIGIGNVVIGAAYVNSTAVQLMSYYYNGSATTTKFLLMNYYNTAQSITINAAGTTTVKVWSNETIVTFYIPVNGVVENYSEIVTAGIPAVRLPIPSGLPSDLWLMVPAFIGMGFVMRRNTKDMSIGLIVIGIIFPFLVPMLGVQMKPILLYAISSISLGVGGVLLYRSTNIGDES